MASLDDVITQLQSVNKTLGMLVSAVNNLATAIGDTFPRITGSFTMTASATLAVPQPGILATSQVILTPRNASAAVLQGGANALYVSAITAGTGFTVATASGSNAAGTEVFSYVASNPE